MTAAVRGAVESRAALPDQNLKLGVSMPFGVIVRPRLNDEQHQLLLLLRLKERIKAPESKPACEALVGDFSTMADEALLEKYGGRGVYEKAARLAAGAPAGLPNIVRGHEEEDADEEGEEEDSDGDDDEDVDA